MSLDGITLHPLPKGWQWVELGEVVDILDSRRVPVNASEREQRNKGIGQTSLFPYYGATGLVGYIDNYIFDEELVLLGEDGAPFLEPYKEKAYLVTGKYWVNNHAHVLRAKKGFITNRFLKHSLNNVNYRDFITGTTRYKLNQAQMAKIPIPLPPLPEQERIVGRIEALLSHVDAGEAALTHARAALKRARASLLQAATTGRLTHPHLPPGELPPGWVWSTVGEVSVIKGGKRLPKGHGYSKIPTAYPYIRVTDFSDYGISQEDLRYLVPETQKMISRYLIYNNDVYISIAGSIGKVGMIPENLNGANLTENAARITEIKGMAPKFLMYSLSSPDGIQQIEKSTISTNQPKLALFRIAQLRIPKPRLSEQEIIVLEIDRQLSSIQMAEVTIGQQIMRSRRLRQSILSAAFSGRL